MSDWWKDPRLDDEGTYDYLVEPLPKDYAKWKFDRYKWKCDACGKESRLRFCSEHFFYCWDGWDSMYYAECWRCILKSNIKSKLRHMRFAKQHIKQTLKAIGLKKLLPTLTFKQRYKLSKEQSL